MLGDHVTKWGGIMLTWWEICSNRNGSSKSSEYLNGLAQDGKYCVFSLYIFLAILITTKGLIDNDEESGDSEGATAHKRPQRPSHNRQRQGTDIFSVLMTPCVINSLNIYFIIIHKCIVNCIIYCL